jgi:two-component system CheB/CheR fusion protein
MENGQYERLPLPLVNDAAQSHGRAQTEECAIVVLDRTANVTSWNAKAERLFGYPAEMAIGKPFYHFLDLESLTPGGVEWDLLTAYYRGVSICDRQYAHSDGSRFRATAEISPLWEGEFLGYKLAFSSVVRVSESIE